MAVPGDRSEAAAPAATTAAAAAAAVKTGSKQAPSAPLRTDDSPERTTALPSAPKQITISPPSSQQSPRSSPQLKAVSPRTSRDPSPTRGSSPTPPSNSNAKATATATASTSAAGSTTTPGNASARSRATKRSRKNSEELSPHRSAAPPAARDIPSAAAVQRALSATGVPRLTPDASADAARSRAARSPTGTGASGSTAPASSGRVKSPPRSAPTSRASSTARRAEAAPAATQSIDELASKAAELLESTKDGEHADPALRSPTRASFGGSTLEAVQESSLPETPAIGHAASSASETTERAITPLPKPTVSTETEELTPKATAAVLSTESESESSSSKKLSPTDAYDLASSQSSLAQAVNRNATLQPKKSFSQMSTASNKSKGGADGSVRNMTVETVDTKALPHLAVSGAASDRGGNRTDGSGTLRVKPSHETIRPKKEKKKTARKTGPGAGAPSSKADIFEAKVASAVDEADSSDSGETFVYESNPPEPPARNSVSRFHHSRTPSAQSMASGLDHIGRGRSDGYNSVVGKKSMKFTNSLHNLSDYHADGDTSTGPSTTGANSSHRSGPHHIGRHGRNVNAVSILNSDAPLVTTPTRMRNNQRHGSRSNTPRGTQFGRSPTGRSQKHSAFELDDDDPADDEETPLIHSANSQRSYYGRSARRAGARYRPGSRGGRSNGFVRGAFGWVLLGALVAVLVAAVVTALVLCSKPLRNVHIGKISNVVASEEEVVLDLRVFATNPNLITIQVDQLDMKLFAKSKYVGSTARSANHVAGEKPVDEEYGVGFEYSSGNGGRSFALGNVDEGTDPIDDEPGGVDTMLLGHVPHLDSPLAFAPSPFSHALVSDVGEISLRKPANESADDGTERWKTVVQHPFDLIIVGQLKYSLPISSKIHSVSVGRGLVHVTPNEPEEPPSPPPPDHGGKNRTNSTSPGFMPGPVKVKTYPITMHFAA